MSPFPPISDRIVVRVYEDVDAAARAVADRIVAAIREKPSLVLGLPTGRTPQPVYAELKRRHAAGTVDFARVTTFNLDEFVGVAATQLGSFRRVMQEQFFDTVNVMPERIGFLDGMAADPEDECQRYERAIEAAGGIDLQFLGIGTNGHIGFNEPGDRLMAATHRAELLSVTREANAPLFGGHSARVPRFALTVGIGTILSAREVILVAFGDRKARCIEEMIRGPLTTQLPASFLQLHPRVELFLDRGAASRLT
jgi:glucosamine-6-phosphate deaminase